MLLKELVLTLINANAKNETSVNTEIFVEHRGIVYCLDLCGTQNNYVLLKADKLCTNCGEKLGEQPATEKQAEFYRLPEGALLCWECEHAVQKETEK